MNGMFGRAPSGWMAVPLLERVMRLWRGPRIGKFMTTLERWFAHDVVLT